MSLLRPPLALYIHIPWCVRKCPYCDFNSHQAPAGELPEARYIDALIGDLEHDLKIVDGHELHSIFIGGGTPSLFSPESIKDLLGQVATRVACRPDLEVTLEANPGTIEHGRFAAYREAGITRVSLGVQSFNADHLKRLGRIHSPDDVLRAIAELQAADIRNFNLDLMYALPEQTREQAIQDVATAIELRPSHLSHYQLTLEPGTAFHHRPPARMPDPESAWDMQTGCQALLADGGFKQYEVSAYAMQGQQCRHNLNYWKFGDYIGVGAGAHGKVTDMAQGKIVRTTRHKQPGIYLSAPSAADRLQEVRVVAGTELPFEYMLNALRLREGFSMDEFEARTGQAAASVDQTLRQAHSKGLMEAASDGRWRASDLGWRFLNDVQELFLT